MPQAILKDFVNKSKSLKMSSFSTRGVALFRESPCTDDHCGLRLVFAELRGRHQEDLALIMKPRNSCGH